MEKHVSKCISCSIKTIHKKICWWMQKYFGNSKSFCTCNKQAKLIHFVAFLCVEKERCLFGCFFVLSLHNVDDDDDDVETASFFNWLYHFKMCLCICLFVWVCVYCIFHFCIQFPMKIGKISKVFSLYRSVHFLSFTKFFPSRFWMSFVNISKI